MPLIFCLVDILTQFRPLYHVRRKNSIIKCFSLIALGHRKTVFSRHSSDFRVKFVYDLNNHKVD